MIINSYRVMLYLPSMKCRSSHNLISFLKNPHSAVKKARAAKIALHKDYKCDQDKDGFNSKFPKNFSRKVQVNTSDSHQLHLVNKETAEKIAKHLTESIDLSKTFVEANPGVGLLTDLLVQSGLIDLRLFEGQPEFYISLRETYTQVHPNRVKLENFDLFKLGRYMFVDRVTGGTRSDTVLSDLPSAKWQNDTNFTLFGATGSNLFIWHLIHSIVLQNSILSLGRCELYLVMPSISYLTLTSSPSSAIEYYRSLSILFQIFFEYRLLDKFPRADFLPQICNSSRLGTMKDRHYLNIKGIQFTTIDPDLMYFVKIVPRRDLYDWCPLAQIKELWHFISLNCQSRQNRIIPLLEKTIPGCGSRLLLNFCTKESIRAQRIHDVDLIETPPSTNPSMTLSDRDYYENINIYTKFGDLQPTQLLTLFHEFLMLPEYSSCSFLPSLETVLMKKNIIR